MRSSFAVLLFGILLPAFGASGQPPASTNAVPESPTPEARHWKPLYFSLLIDEDQKWMAPTEPFDVRGLAVGPVLTGIQGTMAGVSVSGLATAVEDRFFGVGVAGLAHFGRTGYGVQAAIGANAFQNFYGLQLGGMGNCASGGGIQLALGFNETDDCFNLGDKFRNDGRTSEWTGLQLAGINNRACFLDGVQASLCYNYAFRCRGIQLAAWNEADELYGIQVGLINEAHSGAGVQIGLFNFFGDGDGRLLLPVVNARF